MEIANALEVEIERDGYIVAHMGCFFANGEVQIKDLFVCEKFRGIGLDNLLMEQVHEYAHEKNARTIKAFCGPEPFCEDAQVSMSEEVAWYKTQGFIHDHDVCGVVPVMIKTLQPKGDMINDYQKLD